MAAIDQDQLQRLADSIVATVNPSLVVLFGSHSRKTAKNDSDIDLLIVGDAPSITGWSRRKTIGKIRRNLPSMGVPIDVLYFTPDEVTRWRDTTNHVVSRALREGAVLYERP